MRLPREDDGSIAPLVPIMALVLLLLGGVVIDGARLLNTRSRAVAYAEEAARAGASAVVPGQPELDLDPRLVRERVDAYCASLQDDPETASFITECRLDATDDATDGIEAVGNGDSRRIVVRVRVRMAMTTSLVGLVGVDELGAEGLAKARPFEGATGDDVDSEPPPVDPAPEGSVGPPPDVDVGDDDGDDVCPRGTRPGEPGCTPPCPPDSRPGTPECPDPPPVPSGSPFPPRDTATPTPSAPATTTPPAPPASGTP